MRGAVGVGPFQVRSRGGWDHAVSDVHEDRHVLVRVLGTCRRQLRAAAVMGLRGLLSARSLNSGRVRVHPDREVVMDVLGVDQSLTCTGLAKTTFAGVVLTARVRTSPDGDELGDIRRRVRLIVGQVLRFAPDECVTVIEAPVIPRGHSAGAILERAWLFGMLVDQLMLRGPVVRVHQATRAMYAADSGRAEKAVVLEAMRAKFPELAIADDNVADALAMAAMGARWLGSPIDGEMSKKQARAMVAVRWPNPKEK